MKVALALVVLAACASHEPPYVHVTGDRAQLGVDEVAAWDLGFAPGLEDAGLPECSETWYSDTFALEGACQITIRIAFVPDLRDDDVGGGPVNGRADAAARTVEINGTLKFTEDQTRHVVLHEVGHVLLDTGMHLDSFGGRFQPVGVMQSRVTDYPTTPSANDYALACYTIGVCKETP